MTINRSDKIRDINDRFDAIRSYVNGYHEALMGSIMHNVGDAPFPACLYPIKRYIEYKQRKEISHGVR